MDANRIPMDSTSSFQSLVGAGAPYLCNLYSGIQANRALGDIRLLPNQFSTGT